MAKKIVINGRFLTHRITGVERYAREITAELDNILTPDIQVSMAVPPETESIPEYKNIKVFKIGKLHNRMWEHISFPKYVKAQHAISLNLCNVAPLPEPDIVCIHDVKIKARPQDFSRKFLYWYKLLFDNEMRRSKAIITVSEFSKQEIIKYYRISSDKITVIPNAWQHYQRLHYDENALKKFGLVKNSFYFSMSSLEPNKNLKWVADEAIKNSNQIFAVAGAINKTVFSQGLGFECPDNMKLLGYVSDEEAKTLMRDCKAFLFPTFYEGFGIPPLEAISVGCKYVVTSDTTVMHEVFGENVCYVNPFKGNVNLNCLLNNSNLYYNYKKLLDKYSWRKSAELLKKLLVKE